MIGTVSSFHIAFSVVRKNFIKMLRENLLGVLWLFLTPLLYSIFFLLVKSSISGHDVSYDQLKTSAFNAFIGLLLIQLWFQVVQDTANVVRKNKNSLRSLNVSVSPFILAIGLEAGVHLLIRIAIIFIALVVFQTVKVLSGSHILLLCLASVCFMTTSLFVGLLLAPWATLFSDVRSFLTSALMPTALLSPIFYFPVTEKGSFLFWVNHLVPFASIQSVVSDVLFKRDTLYLLPLGAWTVIGLIGTLAFARLIKYQTPILLERLGN